MGVEPLAVDQLRSEILFSPNRNAISSRRSIVAVKIPKLCSVTSANKMKAIKRSQTLFDVKIREILNANHARRHRVQVLKTFCFKFERLNIAIFRIMRE